MSEICQRCEEIDGDRRTLWMACFYEMNELDLPFSKETIRESGINDGHPTDIHNFYTLRVCKTCRADWMQAIKSWFDNPVKRESCGNGIYVRHYGDNIEITEEEFRRYARVKNQ